MKNNLVFFTHDVDAHNHPKFKALRAVYGWEGVGRFWALNEILGATDGGAVSITKKVNRASLASDLGLSVEDFDEFIAFLSDREECGLLTNNDGIISTERIQEDLQRVTGERMKARERYERYKNSEDDDEKNFGEVTAKNDRDVYETSAKEKTSGEKVETSARQRRKKQNFGEVTAKNDREERRGDKIRKEENNTSGVVLDFPRENPGEESDPFADVIPQSVDRHDMDSSDIDRIIAYANQTEAFPPERRLAVNIPNSGQVLDALSFYSKEEIKQALDNYAECIRAPDTYRITPYRSLINFIVNDGVQKFIDAAKPMDRYRHQISAKEADEERRRRESEEQLARERELEEAERRRKAK